MLGPSGHLESFKPLPCTMATARRQWLHSDNKQIKWSPYKRFIASHNKGRPQSCLRGRLAATCTARSPSFLWRASQPSKSIGNKNSNEIGGIFQASFQAENFHRSFLSLLQTKQQLLLCSKRPQTERSNRE